MKNGGSFFFFFVEPCGCHTHLRTHPPPPPGGAIKTKPAGTTHFGKLSLAAMDEHGRQAPSYEMECCVMHPTDDLLTTRSMRKTTLGCGVAGHPVTLLGQPCRCALCVCVHSSFCPKNVPIVLQS